MQMIVVVRLSALVTGEIRSRLKLILKKFKNFRFHVHILPIQVKVSCTCMIHSQLFVYESLFNE